MGEGRGQEAGKKGEGEGPSGADASSSYWHQFLLSLQEIFFFNKIYNFNQNRYFTINVYGLSV